MLALAALALACFVLRPPPTGGPALRDFEAYWSAGNAQVHGGHPYDAEGLWRFERTVPGVDASRDELLPFVGPPASLWLWVSLAQLPYGLAGTVWSLVLAIALGVLVLGSLKLSGRTIDALDLAAVIVLCGAFGPTISAIALGQVALLSCGAIVAVLLCLRGSGLARAFGAGAAAVVAAFQPNLAVVLGAALLAARGVRRRRFFSVFAAALGAFYLLCATVSDHLNWPLGYFSLLHVHGDAERDVVIQTTASGVLTGLGSDPGSAAKIGLVAAAAVAVLVCIQIVRGRYDVVASTALAAAAIPLALPFAHEHDFALALLPALVCLARASEGQRQLVVIAMLAIATDWLGLAQRPSGVPETIAMTFAAGLCLQTIGARTSSWRFLVIPLGASIVVGAVGYFAALHPIAMWPDGMPPHWQESAKLSNALPAAAKVWHDEQHAAGLGSPNPFSALLRALSLLGAGALWYSASRVLAAPAVRRA